MEKPNRKRRALIPVAVRIARHTSVSVETDCHVWTGAKNNMGYGMIRVEEKTKLVHRVSYELANGPIGDGLTLDHLCRNTACVNPRHLEPVTHRVNVLRGTGCSARAARKTHCPYGHTYAGDNLYVAPGGGRQCRICARRRAKEIKIRRKQKT